MSKQLLEKWGKIEDVALKYEVREKISYRWTNFIADEKVDWWKVPPTSAMERMKTGYLQGC